MRWPAASRKPAEPTTAAIQDGDSPESDDMQADKALLARIDATIEAITAMGDPTEAYDKRRADLAAKIIAAEKSAANPIGRLQSINARLARAKTDRTTATEVVKCAAGKVIEAQAISDKAQEEADAANQLVVDLEKELAEATRAAALASNPPPATDPDTVAVRALPLASAVMASLHGLEGMDEKLAKQIRDKVSQALCAQGIRVSQAQSDERTAELIKNKPVVQRSRPPRRSASASARGHSASRSPSRSGRSDSRNTSRERIRKAGKDPKEQAGSDVGAPPTAAADAKGEP